MIYKILCSFLLFSCSEQLFSGQLKKDNILSTDENASSTIQFCITRNLTNGALKNALIEQLKQIFQLNAFVETGTYLGDTTLVAARLFEEVHTIELSPQLTFQAKTRFKEWKNVEVYQGDSADVLGKILPKISDSILIYLDGHYSGGITAKGDLNTPLLGELNRIKEAQKSNVVILIDDIRLCQITLYPGKLSSYGLDNYPDVSEVVEILLEINPQYQICFLGDALLAFPKNPSVKISPVVEGCALHRLSSACVDCTEEDLLRADLLISQATGDERDEIELYYRIYSAFELEYGYRCFGSFWLGLILKNEGHEKEAASLFQTAAKNSLPGWRIEKYLE